MLRAVLSCVHLQQLQAWDSFLPSCWNPAQSLRGLHPRLMNMAAAFPFAG